MGFYFVRNTGVPPALVEAAFAAAARFHAQPLDAKLAMPFDDNNQGYLPFRGNISRMNAVEGIKQPNANAAVFFKRELPADHPDVLAGRRFRGVNQWPADLPGFRDVALDYAGALEALGRRLVPIYAAALGLPDDWFADKFREPMFTLRMTHYPQQAPTAPDDEWGLAPHADTSFMTILAQNKVPGLALRLPDGRWIDAPAPEGAFLVNGGMMLRRWTNHAFSPRRIGSPTGPARNAMPSPSSWMSLRRGDGADPDLRHRRKSPPLSTLHLSRVHERVFQGELRPTRALGRRGRVAGRLTRIAWGSQGSPGIAGPAPAIRSGMRRAIRR